MEIMDEIRRGVQDLVNEIIFPGDEVARVNWSSYGALIIIGARIEGRLNLLLDMMGAQHGSSKGDCARIEAKLDAILEAVKPKPIPDDEPDMSGPPIKTEGIHESYSDPREVKQ